MANVVIFATDRLASLAHYYLRHDSPHEVVGFVNPKCFARWEERLWGEFEGLPVIPLEELEQVHPPDGDVRCFAPAEQSHDRRRETGYGVLKPRGYAFVSYQSTSAAVSPDAVIGENCLIHEHCTIQPFVRIGDDVMLGAGSHIGHHSTIGDHVVLGSHAVIGEGCIIDPECVLCANATITACRHIAPSTLVREGTTIRQNTDRFGIYAGAVTGKRLP